MPRGASTVARLHEKRFSSGPSRFSAFAQNAPTGTRPAPPPKHFDHVLIVVLENQNYESAIRNDLEKPRPEGRNLQQFRQRLALLVSKLLSDDSGQ